MTDRRYVVFSGGAYALTDDDARIYGDGDLPGWLVQLQPTEAKIRDLSWFSLAAPKSGFWPIDYAAVSFDPATQTVERSFTLQVANKVVKAAGVVVDRPPSAEPAVLGKGEFYDLVRGCDVTFAQIKTASADPALEEFWFALSGFYSQIRRDHPSTRQGVGAMVALGHISQASADKIFSRWP